MKCPHCDKPFKVPEIVHVNIQNYGSNTFYIPCSKCKKMVQVYGQRYSKIDFIEKSYSKHASFSSLQMEEVK